MKLHHVLRSFIPAVAVGAFALAASVPAHAGTIWTNWTYAASGPWANANGTLNGVSVQLWGDIPGSNSGPVIVTPGIGLSSQYGPSQGALYPGENSDLTLSATWNGPTDASSNSFTGIVTCTSGAGTCTTWNYTATPGLTAPPTSGDSAPLIGGSVNLAQPEEVEFFSATGASTSVTNPLIAIWSLGNVTSDTSAEFIFSEPFILVAGGPDAQYPGGEALQTSDASGSACDGLTDAAGDCYIASGEEASGILLFPGTYSSISFITPDYENYYAITVGEGLSVIPEPETLSLLGLGLLVLPLLRASLARRRA